MRKVNLENVLASLDAVCPKCSKTISPAEVRHVDFERIECPMYGERFAPIPRQQSKDPPPLGYSHLPKVRRNLSPVGRRGRLLTRWGIPCLNQHRKRG